VNIKIGTGENLLYFVNIFRPTKLTSGLMAGQEELCGGDDVVEG